VIAVSIFAIALGAVAQGLAYAFGLTNLQNQRITASNDCRAVISGLRQIVAANPDTTACPENANKFPCLLLDYVSRFPANAAAVAALPAASRTPFSGLYTLRDETIAIALSSSIGGAVVNGTTASSSTNPVFVRVTVQWKGPRGITYTETVSTVITNV
jgi:hypothetical protein